MGKADIILTVSEFKTRSYHLQHCLIQGFHTLPLVKKTAKHFLRTVKFTSAYWQTIRGLQIILTTNTNNGLVENIHPLTHF